VLSEWRDGLICDWEDQRGQIRTYPHVCPVTPADIHATIFSALGYNPRRLTYHASDGRPMPLTEGEPIKELLA
jgi:hypothetical protein